MGIKVDISGLQKLQGLNERLAEEMKQELSYVGNECVKQQRENHENNWRDRTGNLRSSIGYAVYVEGREAIKSAFEAIGTGAEGSTKGKQYIDELARLYSNTYVLLMVAGMDYAGYVEAKGYDVLAGARLTAQEKITKAIQRAIKRATRQ